MADYNAMYRSGKKMEAEMNGLARGGKVGMPHLKARMNIAKPRPASMKSMMPAPVMPGAEAAPAGLSAAEGLAKGGKVKKYAKGGAVDADAAQDKKMIKGIVKPDCIKKAKGGAIHIKPENKGKLHADLGVKQGEKIPAKKLASAKKNAGPAEKKRIVFAQNAKSWNHK